MTHEEIAALLDKADEHIEKSEFALAEKLANEVLSSGAERKDEARALSILGRCCYGTVRLGDSLAHFGKAFNVAESAQDLSLQARALVGLALTHLQLNENVAARQYAERSLSLAQTANDRKIEETALGTLGDIFQRENDIPRALEYLTQSLAIGEEIGLKANVADNLCRIGMIHANLGSRSLGLEYYTRALPIAEESGSQRTIAEILGLIGFYHFQSGDNLRSLDYLARSLAIAEKLANKWLRANTLIGMGTVYSVLGDFSREVDCRIRALDLSEELGSKNLIVESLGGLALSYDRIGDSIRALQYKERALALAEEIGDNENVAINLGNIGDSYITSGDYGQALEYLNRALDLSKKIGASRPIGYWLHSIALVEHKLGNHEAANQGFLDTLHHSREVLKSNEHVAETLLELGRVLIEQGKTEEGLARLEEALALAEELGEKKTASNAHKAIADAYGKMGDTAKAYEHITKHLALDKEIFSEEARKNVEKFNMRVAIADMESQKEVQRLKAERSEHETEIQKVRAEQSERELSNSTLQLVAQTELLSELRDGLLQFIRRFPLPDGAARELRDRLKTLPCKSVDWKKFDTQFKSAHPEFARQLIEAHPTLTPTELRMCSLLRMNLRSAEIAQLFCLSERTVEHHRAHIRTKMKLKNSQDLMKVLAAM